MKVLTKKLAVASMEVHFEQSAEQFKKLCSGSNWAQLETAMWALQRVRQMDETEIEQHLGQIGVGLWPQTLREISVRAADSTRAQ